MERIYPLQTTQDPSQTIQELRAELDFQRSFEADLYTRAIEAYAAGDSESAAYSAADSEPAGYLMGIY